MLNYIQGKFCVDTRVINFAAFTGNLLSHSEIVNRVEVPLGGVGAKHIKLLLRTIT